MCTGYPAVCPQDCAVDVSLLNIANNESFALLEALFSELGSIFPDRLFHIGGDEVNTACWFSDPSIAAWLQKHGMDGMAGYGYFVNQTTAMALAQGRLPVAWEDVWQNFGTEVNQNVVIQAWLSVNTPPNATAHGYRSIWSVDGHWYLDGLDVTWDSMWSEDPLFNISAANRHLMLGGEGCMWSETVDDSDLENTVWPRAAAIAERLWSYDTIGFPNPTFALRRIELFRCLLLRRGTAAAPVTNPVAREAPSGPGSCSWQ
jgi:hexosaminidase